MYELNKAFNSASMYMYVDPHCDPYSGDLWRFCPSFCLQHLLQCMCGNNMSVPLLAEAVTVSGMEKETAAVSETTKPQMF